MWPPCAEDVESWRSDRSATWIIPSLCCQSYLTYLLWSDLLNNTIADSCSVPPSRAVQQGDPFRAGIFPLWVGLLKERRFCGPCIIFWHSLCYTNYSVITLQICTHTHKTAACLVSVGFQVSGAAPWNVQSTHLKRCGVDLKNIRFYYVSVRSELWWNTL